MKDNQFDDLVKNRLQNYESPVPTNMWERIAGKEKERKGGFTMRLYLLSAALAVIGFANIYFFLYIHNRNSKDVAFGKNNMHITIIKKDINKLNNDKSDSLQALSIVKQDRPGKISNTIRINKQIRNDSFLKSEKERRQASYKQQSFVKYSNKIIGSNGLTNNRKAADYQNNSYQNNNIDSLAKKRTKESSVTKSDMVNNREMKEEEIYNDKFSVELYISPDVPVNLISSANKSYEQVLKRAGNMQVSYTFGARMNYEITKNISAKIGIQYAQINEKIAFADTVPANNFTSANRYKNVGVPLLISYKTNWISNLHLSINTGIILNITSRYKGAIPSVSGLQVDIRSNNVYDRNTSAILYLGMDISKKITRRADIFAEPWFNYRLKNIVNSFYPFNQKIHTSGLSLGLRYRLLKNE